MAAADCKFIVNKAEYKKLLENATEQGLIALGEQALADSNEYVKVDQAVLRASGRVDRRGTEIELSYNTPYAKRQYFTGNPSPDVNAQASLMWMHKAQKVHGVSWLKILKKAFKGVLG